MEPSTSPANASLAAALARIAQGDPLTQAEAHAAFRDLMAGTAPDADIRALLLGLRARGESASEVAGAVAALREAMRVVPHPSPDDLVDTCGTGGGSVRTLNISTAAAFVVAGAGLPVAKHGNRSFTSRSGSADVLEAMGIAIDLTPERAAAILQQVGLVFLFAPSFHPAMRHVGPVRKALGVPTVMNLVGPLSNPARATRQVVGVADPERAPIMAGALAALGARHAMVVHGEIGVDEIAPVGATRIWEVQGGAVREWRLVPADFGLAADSMIGTDGGEPAENAERIEALRAAVLLNAGAAIHVGGGAASLEEAMAKGRASLEGGHAARVLDALRRASSGE